MFPDKCLFSILSSSRAARSEQTRAPNRMQQRWLGTNTNINGHALCIMHRLDALCQAISSSHSGLALSISEHPRRSTQAQLQYSSWCQCVNSRFRQNLMITRIGIHETGSIMSLHKERVTERTGEKLENPHKSIHSRIPSGKTCVWIYIQGRVHTCIQACQLAAFLIIKAIPTRRKNIFHQHLKCSIHSITSQTMQEVEI